MPAAGIWPIRLLWLVLPFAAGPTTADALDAASRPVQLTASVGLWSAWALGVTATLLPRTLSLTVVRTLVPGAVAAAAWSAVAHGPDARDALALGSVTAAAIAAFSPLTGEAFVDGSSYGSERRLPLRVPAAVAAGPLQLTWLVLAAGLTAGPLLLAARAWVAGAVATGAGVVVAFASARRLHALARRWVVFVPAGLVIHDPLTLAEPVLFPRPTIASLAPAPADTTALDLTGGALGLALELRLVQPARMALAGRRRRTGPMVEADRLMFTPTRPGSVLAEARARRIPTPSDQAATPPPTTSSPS